MMNKEQKIEHALMPHLPQANVIGRLEHATGVMIDNDDTNWSVQCPKCERDYEVTGFFDKDEITICKCGCQFVTEELIN